MTKQILFLILLCISSLPVFAQIEKYAVPVKWENYSVSENNLSISLPKMPVMKRLTDYCYELERKEYAVYADQTIYGLTISSKPKGKSPYECSTSRKFSEKYFSDRISELRKETVDASESKFSENDLTYSVITGKYKTYWLVNDYANKRWFELWVIGADKEKDAAKNFIRSIAIGKTASGIEIGDGAEQTFGDLETEKNEVKSDEPDMPINIGFKPPPRYTEAARGANIQGTVTLKVTFLSNGAIGSVTPVSSLPYGLTEQAINMAKRIVFIPPRRKGISYSVSKTITYNFSIY